MKEIFGKYKQFIFGFAVGAVVFGGLTQYAIFG